MRTRRQIQPAVTGLHSGIYRTLGGRGRPRLGEAQDLRLPPLDRHGKQRPPPPLDLISGADP